MTSAYSKPTFSGIFTNLESFITDIYKRGLIGTLLYRNFRLFCNYENFHQDIKTLKSIFKHYLKSIFKYLSQESYESLELYFTEILDYSAIMRTFIKILKL